MIILSCALLRAWEQEEKTCDSYTNEGIQLNMHPRIYEPLTLARLWQKFLDLGVCINISL